MAGAGGDGTVGLREASTGRPFGEGHTGTVWGVALSDNGELVASGSYDGTVKLWEAKSGACLRTLQPEPRYERLDVTGLTGIIEAQRTALLALGAVEQRAQPVNRPP